MTIERGSSFRPDIKTRIERKVKNFLEKIGVLDPVIRPRDLEILGNGERTGEEVDRKTHLPTSDDEANPAGRFL